jgi:RNA polymerase sigma-70 factor, ECF subfamily
MRTLLNACVHAWETGNLAGPIALLTDDAILTMPPPPSRYQGQEAIRTFLTTSMFAGVGHQRGYRLIPTHANDTSRQQQKPVVCYKARNPRSHLLP